MTIPSAEQRPVLAIDIGGSKCAAALVLDDRLLRRSQRPTPAEAGPEAVVAAAVAAAAEVLAATGHAPADPASAHPGPATPAAAIPAPTTVGIACAGLVRAGSVWAVSPDLLRGWQGFPLVAAFSEALGLPAVALNDAQAAAWGEARKGAGVGSSSLLFVTVSTGVGGGLVSDGRLWLGRGGLAGHIGQLQSDPRGGTAASGRRGILESIASGTALARRAAALGHQLDAREVLACSAAGEAWAQGLVAQAAEALAQALADVQALVDPELVVLGGGVGLNPVFGQDLAEAVARLPDAFQPRLVAAALGADAGLVGAADWAARQTDG